MANEWYDRACKDFKHHTDRGLYFRESNDNAQALKEFAEAYSSFFQMSSIYENLKKSPSDDKIYYDPREKITFFQTLFEITWYIMKVYLNQGNEPMKFYFLLDVCIKVYEKLGDFNKSFDREMLEYYKHTENQISQFIDDPKLGEGAVRGIQQCTELAKKKKGIAAIDSNDATFTLIRQSYIDICKLQICQIPITSYEPPEYSMSLIIGGLIAGVIFWLSGWNFGLAVFIWIGSSAAIAYFVWKDDNKE